MFIVIGSDTSVLVTLASLKGFVEHVGIALTGTPDPGLARYLEEHPELPTWSVDGTTPKELHAFFRELQPGLLFFLKGGAITLKDPRELTVTAHESVYGWTRKHYYAKRMNKDAMYRTLKADPKVPGEVFFHIRTDCEWTDQGVMYGRGVVWGDDPIVEIFMRGADRLKHAWHGTQAAVLDYWTMLVDREATVQMCHSGPLELYQPAVEAVREYLAADTYATIQRNVKRAVFVAGLRSVISRR